MTKLSGLAFLPLLILILLVAAFTVTLERSGADRPKFAQHIGDPAPATALPLQNVAAAVYNNKDWIGRAYVVNFFASWCVPCRGEHEVLRQLAASGIPIIGIAYKDKSQAVTSFLSKEGNPYLAVADDQSGRAGIDWAITGVPETFMIDRQGMIRFHSAGPLSPSIIDHDFMPVWRKVKP